MVSCLAFFFLASDVVVGKVDIGVVMGNNATLDVGAFFLPGRVLSDIGKKDYRNVCVTLPMVVRVSVITVLGSYDPLATFRVDATEGTGETVNTS